MDITHKGEVMIEKLKEWASKRGYRVGWGSGSIVDTVKQEISERKSESEINKRFFKHAYKRFEVLIICGVSKSI